MARSIVKFSYNNPLICFDLILEQVPAENRTLVPHSSQAQSFDNMAPIIVDCLKYMPMLNLDVVGTAVLALSSACCNRSYIALLYYRSATPCWSS
jgi:hypothetical protein